MPRDQVDRPVVMQVGPAPSDGPADEVTAAPTAGGSQDASPDGDRRRAWLRNVAVVAVALATVAVAVALGHLPRTPDVRVPVDGGEGLVAAPAAPPGAVARRWSVPLPDTRVATGLAVVDDVAVVMDGPSAGPRRDDRRVTVAGHDLADGRRRWLRRFPEDTVVVVGPSGDRVVLPTVGGNTWDDGREQWDVRTVVALDADDGTVRWRRDRLGPTSATSTLLRRTTDELDVRSDQRFRVLDLDDGVVRHRFTVHPEPDWREPTRTDGGWIVPTDLGWDLVTDDGARRVLSDEASPFVGVLDGTFVQADARRVEAHDLATGRVAWTHRFADPIEWMNVTDPAVRETWAGPVAFPPDPRRPDTPGIFVVTAHRAADASSSEPTGWAEHVLSPDGTPRWERSSETDDRTPALVTDLEVDGQTWSLCLEEGGDASPGGTCPAPVALADPTGAVVGTVPGPRAGVAWPAWPRVTRAGLLVPGPGDGGRRVVSLRRWPDLSVAWSVSVGLAVRRAGRGQPLVATTPHGVAVVQRGTVDRLVWHR